jgi:predicted RecB family nuclease
MQLIDGRPVYSASDLVGYLACEHLTQLERAAVSGLTTRPHLDDPELDILRRRGFEHEARYLESLRADGASVHIVDPDAYPDDSPGDRLRAATDDTVVAMAAGVDVVYQATFFDGTWRGHADFLLRTESTERPSRWGPYHYEVADTKLARHVKAGAVLQICSYVDQLTALQGVEPERLHVVLGGSARRTETLRVGDFMAYYRAARDRFMAAVGGAAAPATYPPAATYPEPVSHCDVCRWAAACARRRRDDDHLSLVAGISSRQRRALVARGIETVADLAALPLPVQPPLEGVTQPAVERVREQARLQVEGRAADRTLYELLLPPEGEAAEPDRGLATLPAPEPGDLFFDIEGDPYALEDGLDYLFGVMEADGTWHAFWSTDADGEFTLDGEKAAFQALMDFFVAHLDRYPGAHIYHYAPYEPTALKRLMGRHGTREDEVDGLLRGGRLVDLLRAVRQGVRASVESYSIKKLEPLYAFERSVELRDAGSSIVEFEQWLQLGEGDRPESGILERIEGYNRDDVVSNRALRDWLEARREELADRTGHPVPRPEPRAEEAPEALADQLARVEELAAALTAGVAADPALRSATDQARWLLAQLLSWHRREDKSFWWLYFHLRDDLTDEERIEAGEPIGGLVYEGVIGEEKRSLIHRYRFPQQEHDVRPGGYVKDPVTGKSPGTVVAVDNAALTVDLKRARTNPVPHPTSLIPHDYFDPKQHVASLVRLAEWVLQHGIDADDRERRAIRDLLLRKPPRLASGRSIAALDGESDLARARRLAVDLDATALAMQGPPGSGKTYTGARMALDLVRAGKRIGVTANSHKVIGNFLAALCKAASDEGAVLRIGQRSDPDDVFDHPTLEPIEKPEDALAGLASGQLQVLGATSFVWSRPEFADAVDVLFVDEAGQMSLANVAAVSQAAGSIVLLGDPMQLNQPLKGTHPPGAERSALAHMLDTAPTMPPELGLFLTTTWRLHPDLCRFTSAAFYADRLISEPHLAGQEVHAAEPFAGAGTRLVAVPHEGNDSLAEEETTRVANLARALVESGASWVGPDGQLQVITWQEILIVAPYNAQVGAIQRHLPGARVGTVDKFQGQEAPISIYSMTTSSPELAPRGLGFLYSRNRLNVATSRARCIAVVVASPQLLRVRANTVEQMRLASAICQFAELADPVI